MADHKLFRTSEICKTLVKYEVTIDGDIKTDINNAELLGQLKNLIKEQSEIIRRELKDEIKKENQQNLSLCGKY